MEALVALSLAANIVQFVDFSSKLLSTATAIHRSTTGAGQDVQDVDTITEALRQWCDKISSSSGASSQQNALQAHPSLTELARKCQATATELLSVTESLRAKRPGSKWKSLKAALATAWNEERIKGMSEKLDTYRRQLALEIALLQR
jgi:hypothetical protein